MAASKTPILICSCSATYDIAIHTLASFRKHFNNSAFQIYLGANNNQVNIDWPEQLVIRVPQTNWKNETIEQIKELNIRCPGDDLILYLDDFILTKTVNEDALKNFVSIFKLKKMAYLRLSPFESSFAYRAYARLINLRKFFFIVPHNHPYYSSLQVAIWSRSYLISLLGKCQNIWNFENLHSPITTHFCSTETIFKYKHIVEKGKWLNYANRICIANSGFFRPGTRLFCSKKYVIQKNIRFFSFFFFGYFFVRFKSKLFK
jgi:hypothetical protein